MKNDISVEELLSSVDVAEWRDLELQIASNLQGINASDNTYQPMDRLEPTFPK